MPADEGRDTTPRCVVCNDRIEYLDPTGDGLASWWAHEHHPDDHHDAVPPPARETTAPSSARGT